MDTTGWATRLLQAERNRIPIPSLSSSGLRPSKEDAYAIRDQVLSGQEHGGEVVGAKVALHAVDGTPVYGLLGAAALMDPGSPVPLDELIRPLVVPHLALLLKEPLPSARIGMVDVLRATEAVAGAAEIIDSRFEEPFLAVDLAADNAGVARVVLSSSWLPVRRCRELDLVGCLVESGGEVLASGAGAAALGHPFTAACRLAVHCVGRGERFGPGAILLSGGLTAPVELTAPVSVSFARFGTVHLPLSRNG